jgi:hypothetical protein
MSTQVLDADMDVGQHYSLLTLSYAGVSFGLPQDSAIHASAGQMAALAVPEGIEKQALGRRIASVPCNGMACVEVHSAGALLVEREQHSLAVLRRVTIAIALSEGRTTMTFHESGEVRLVEWKCREAGVVLVAVNESASRVLQLEVDWCARGHTRNLLCSRGCSGKSVDVLFPGMGQIVAVFSVHCIDTPDSQLSQSAQTGWSRSCTTKYSVRDVTAIGDLHDAFPPVHNTLHEPEQLG